jgi:general secretion pathway protein J
MLRVNYHSSKASASGFTLIEMLVVMVILAMTTSLLSVGLSNTWRNFERLGARDLMVSSAQLPASWFEQSIKAALLYHPDIPSVKGNSDFFEFITFATPDDPKKLPQKIVWHIERNTHGWGLFFISRDASQMMLVKSFVEQPVFEYLQHKTWTQEFSPHNALLPEAVRIRVDQNIWVLAKPGRPEEADMPVELSVFGVYEF